MIIELKDLPGKVQKISVDIFFDESGVKVQTEPEVRTEPAVQTITPDPVLPESKEDRQNPGIPEEMLNVEF